MATEKKNSAVFSRGIYVRTLERLRVLAVIFAVIIIVPNILFAVFRIIESREYYGRYDPMEPVYDGATDRYSTHELDPQTFIPLCASLILLAPIAVWFAFSFLNKRHESDFYHSIPHKRSSVYISTMAAVLTLCIGVILLSALINSVLAIFAPHFVLSAGTIWQTIFTYASVTVQFIGIMIVAMTLTGSSVMGAFLAIVIAIGIPVINTLSYEYLMEICPIIPEQNTVFQYLWLEKCLPYQIIINLTSAGTPWQWNVHFSSIAPQLISLLSGLVMIALGGLVFCLRPSQTAGQTAIGKRTRHAICIGITVPFMLILAWAIINMQGDAFEIIILMLVSLMVFFLAELITSRSLRDGARAMALVVIPIAVAAAIAGALEITGSVVNATAPSCDELQYVRINKHSALVDNEFFVGFSDLDVDVERSPEIGEIIAQAMESSAHRKNPSNYMSAGQWASGVKLTLKSGRAVWRDIFFTDKQTKALGELLVASDDYYEAITGIPDRSETRQISIGGKRYTTLDAVYDVFIKEYDSLSREEKLKVCAPISSDSSGIVVSIFGYESNRSKSIIVPQDIMPLTALVAFQNQSVTTAIETISDAIMDIEVRKRDVNAILTLTSMSATPRISEAIYTSDTRKVAEYELEEIAKLVGNAGADDYDWSTNENEDVFLMKLDLLISVENDFALKSSPIEVYIKLDAQSYERLVTTLIG